MTRGLIPTQQLGGQARPSSPCRDSPRIPPHGAKRAHARGTIYNLVFSSYSVAPGGACAVVVWHKHCTRDRISFFCAPRNSARHTGPRLGLARPTTDVPRGFPPLGPSPRFQMITLCPMITLAPRSSFAELFCLFAFLD